jgi:hypothetical protein
MQGVGHVQADWGALTKKQGAHCTSMGFSTAQAPDMTLERRCVPRPVER